MNFKRESIRQLKLHYRTCQSFKSYFCDHVNMNKGITCELLDNGLFKRTEWLEIGLKMCVRLCLKWNF